MLEKGVEMELRDLNANPLSAKELDALIGERDYKLFLNTRNELYRERNMAEKPPSRAEALALMAENPNLIRRPIVISGKKIILGYDEEALKELR